jgi:hypothetical protein
MPVSQNVEKAAQEYFTEHFGEQEYVITRTASDRHPKDGRPIHLFMAVRSGVANDKAIELILDNEAQPVQLANERKVLFTPDVEPVPTDVIETVQVKVNPEVNNLRLGECDTVKETITVTIPASAAVAPADIYFLADNTGSMGPVIDAVKTGAAAIFTSLGSLMGLQFGVGEYRDFNNAGDTSDAFQNLQPITANQAAVTTAINTWSATSGYDGGDAPEAQFYALDQVAGSPAIGWRPSVKHIVVWLGDAPGHDPICQAASGLSYDINEASVTSKLTANQITVLAVSVFDSSIDPQGLNDDPTNLGGAPLNPAYTACGSPGGTPGQATRIAAATGGVVVTGVDPSAVVATIIAELKALLTIDDVHLQPVGAIAPFVTSITPPSYGPLPGDQTNVLKFEVTFSGDVEDCSTRDRVFTGAIDVVVDGSVAAAKPTRITVPACKYTYGVKFVCGTQPADCSCGCGPVRPGTYATEINILNPKCKEATIVKRVVPLVFAGAVTGREPAIVHARATETIVLPSGAATMDDCCRIAELLYGGPGSAMPLTVGFLEIVSDVELHVTAVYTSSDLQGNGLSFEVETVPGKLT